ncbi:Ig-like domain-containing protein, partial [Flavobacterium sp. DG2-3]|uniref:beta strand repeat-containing protein n=1 Tax=Flavobacterium sp. DG2-3 TaxID=3068317 RepID=UPI00273EA989
MKLFQSYIYVILSLFTVTILFSQNNSKSTSAYNGKRNPIGAIIGGNSIICAGSKTQFNIANHPTHSGHSGKWSVSNRLVASVNSDGVVTALQPGTFILKYDSDDSDCKGDSYRTVLVKSIPKVSVIGPTSICINGTTKVFPLLAGTWTSSNPAVAIVNNLGIVKGISPGSATFTFTALNGCPSEPTAAVTVSSAANAEIVGSSSICINETTTLSPSTGGTWTSSNKAVATVTNSGVVKGISAGTATFTFTKTGGCSSLPSQAVKVNANTAVRITGSNVICVNATTTLSPTTGGTWSSSNSNIATVSNAGVVTGIAAGKATFVFTKTDGCASLPTSSITINTCPQAIITGPDNICVNGTTTLSPTSGGTWTSSNRAVATVTNAGVVKGISTGTVTFTYTKTGSCSSVPTPVLTVGNSTPARITGTNSICINGTTTLSPTSGGTWSSSNSSVATVSNDGIVTGIRAGRATFIFTKTGGCTSPATSAVTVNDCPVATITGPSSICVNGTTTLSPTTGGTWTSSNKTIATVTNAGVVKGISGGTAKFTFTKTGSCNSLATPAVTVTTAPKASITGSNSICINATTTLSPTSGGTWSSSNPAVATVNNNGVVTGISAGTATFTFTVTGGGCVSAPTSAITINANPVVSAITGRSSIISIGSTTQFNNNTSGGVWSITNGTGSATITASGLVTGTGIGTVKINYTVENGYCKGVVSREITIKAATVLPAITGPDTISISKPSTAFQNETAGGVWSIKNGSGTATITQGGIVQGTQAGTVEVVYTFVD